MNHENETDQLTREDTRATLATIDGFTRGYIEAALWSSTGEPFGDCARCDKTETVLYWNAQTRAHDSCHACSGEGGADSPYEPPLDANYGPEDIDAGTLVRMIEDCARFRSQNRLCLPVYESAREHGEWSGQELAGHDFWLTRNAHGTGFWDRFSKHREGKKTFAWIGDRLAAQCGWRGNYKEVSLYVGDDGKIHT